jgi:polar amino acid transport system substrate-binding protein
MRSRNRLLLAVFAVFLTIGAIGQAYADAMQDIITRGELRVAVQTSGAPFSFIDKKGVRTGSSVEFARLMAEEMGVKVVFLDYDWDGLIPALLSKKADILAADMTANLKRSLKISFANPWYYTGGVIFKKKGAPFNTVDDCNKKGVKVAALIGSTGSTNAQKFLPNAELKQYKGSGTLLVQAVMAGHADVGINDESSVIAQMADIPPNSIEILPGLLSREPLAFAVRPEEQHLLQWINLFFDWIREDGRYDKNINYWVKSLDWKKDH